MLHVILPIRYYISILYAAYTALQIKRNQFRFSDSRSLKFIVVMQNMLCTIIVKQSTGMLSINQNPSKVNHWITIKHPTICMQHIICISSEFSDWNFQALLRRKMACPWTSISFCNFSPFWKWSSFRASQDSSLESIFSHSLEKWILQKDVWILFLARTRTVQDFKPINFMTSVKFCHFYRT